MLGLWPSPYKIGGPVAVALQQSDVYVFSQFFEMSIGVHLGLILAGGVLGVFTSSNEAQGFSSHFKPLNGNMLGPVSTNTQPSLSTSCKKKTGGGIQGPKGCLG